MPHELQSAQSVTWTVAAEPDGILTTGTEVSYLYWEAMWAWFGTKPGRLVEIKLSLSPSPARILTS